MRFIVSFIPGLFALFFVYASTTASALTLAWDPPKRNDNPPVFSPLDDLAYYRVYRGYTASEVNELVVDNLIEQQHKLDPELPDGIYFFAVTAVDTSNNESRLSDILKVIISSSPTDKDGDGVTDDSDNCPSITNPGQGDTDGDGVGDACEFKPDNPIQARSILDFDGDGISDIGHWKNTKPQQYEILLSDANIIITEQFGEKGDLIAPADYNGDGMTDLG